MNLKSALDTLADKCLVTSELTLEVSKTTIEEVNNGQLKIVDFVQILDPILTAGDHQIRFRGLEILTKVVTSLSKTFLSEKEISVITEFIFMRILDHDTMEIPSLKCLCYFITCDHKPSLYNLNLLTFLKTKTHVQRMKTESRCLVYEIISKVLREKFKTSDQIESDLVYSIVYLIENESNPRCLMSCFELISFTLKNFKNLEPYIDDLFEWLSCYYPIDYTPSEKDLAENINIQRSDLMAALYNCFFATPLNSENLQTLLLEKLDSNSVTIKLETIDCLVRCYEVFPFDSIKSFASSLWTAVRIECLKKKDMVNVKLFEAYHKALRSLAKKLSEKDEFYFTFITDIYEELSIAFRKPEMDLFEPAARLLASVLHPKLIGFNYVLEKLVPLSINAISSKEMRPQEGLRVLFEQLASSHADATLAQDLESKLNELCLTIMQSIGNNEDSLGLLNSLVQCKIRLQDSTLNRIVDKLKSEMHSSPLDLERSLSLICLIYRRFDIIFDENVSDGDFSLDTIIRLVTVHQRGTHNPKFSTYLRTIMMMLDSSNQASIDRLQPEELSKFLTIIREKAVKNSDSQALVENVAKIHAILINKLDEQNVTPLLMNFFSSDYCQKLFETTDENKECAVKVYLPVIKWILKSLVMRNHKLSEPLTNLVLNFMTTKQMGLENAMSAVKVFRFVIDNLTMGDCAFEINKDYRVFALYQQKFYTQSKREIQVRYEKASQERGNLGAYMLFCSIAAQVTHLQAPVYRASLDWLIHESLKILSSMKTEPVDEIVGVLLECVEKLMQDETRDQLGNRLATMADLNLYYARCRSSSLNVRRRALVCIAKIASSFNETELLLVRPNVISQLKPCLDDKKRLVRQAAAEARLRWILVGQPIGS